MTYFDHNWHGTPDAISAAIEGHTNILGPRELDGIAYTSVRSTEVLEKPRNVSATGAQLAAAILGVWMSASEEEI
jgi:hypothetical protein